MRSVKGPVTINLKDIDSDLQTRYIRSAASTFEFKATVEGTGIVEGLMRYHPFLYDHETYPRDDIVQGKLLCSASLCGGLVQLYAFDLGVLTRP